MRATGKNLKQTDNNMSLNRFFSRNFGKSGETRNLGSQEKSASEVANGAREKANKDEELSENNHGSNSSNLGTPNRSLEPKSGPELKSSSAVSKAMENSCEIEESKSETSQPGNVSRGVLGAANSLGSSPLGKIGGPKGRRLINPGRVLGREDRS